MNMNPTPGSFPIFLDWFLLIPLVITAGIAGLTFYKNRIWGLNRAIVLGIPIPLATIYAVPIGWAKYVPGEALMDRLYFQFVGVLLFAPQSFILYFMGIYFLLRFFGVGRGQWNGSFGAVSATLIVAILGHVYTRLILFAA